MVPAVAYCLGFDPCDRCPSEGSLDANIAAPDREAARPARSRGCLRWLRWIRLLGGREQRPVPGLGPGRAGRKSPSSAATEDGLPSRSGAFRQAIRSSHWAAGPAADWRSAPAGAATSPPATKCGRASGTARTFLRRCITTAICTGVPTGAYTVWGRSEMNGSDPRKTSTVRVLRTSSVSLVAVVVNLLISVVACPTSNWSPR